MDPGDINVEGVTTGANPAATGSSSSVDAITYWQYLRLDELLSLQSPRTTATDEPPFIILHQIAELLFAAIVHELKQITDTERNDPDQWRLHLTRIIRYFRALMAQLTMTGKSIEKAQFQRFRHALFPASGFQSVQYREMEIRSARLYDLVSADDRRAVSRASTADELFEYLYWRRVGSATTQGRNETLVNFEAHYLPYLRSLASHCIERNLAVRFQSFPAGGAACEEIAELLRRYDRLANRLWPEVHLRLAADFLRDGPVALNSTGDTDWRKYLQAKQTHVCYFPELVTRSAAPY